MVHPYKVSFIWKRTWKQGLVKTAIFYLWISWHQVPVYIAEISPQNMRGALGSVNQVYSYSQTSCLFWGKHFGLFMPTSLCILFILQLSVTLGIMFAYLLGMFVPWRLLAVIGNIAEPWSMGNAAVVIKLLPLVCASTLTFQRHDQLRKWFCWSISEFPTFPITLGFWVELFGVCNLIDLSK